MVSLLDPRPIEPLINQAIEVLRPNAILVVGGPEGAGRGHFIKRVAESRKTLELEAPPLDDADAGVHVLLQLMAFVPEQHRDDILAAKDLRSSAFEATKRAIEENKAEVLSLRLPRSWEKLLHSRDDEDQRRLDRIRDVLYGIQDYSGVPLMVLCGAARMDWKRWLRSPLFIRLGPAPSNMDLMGDETLWGDLVSHARDVRDAWHGHEPGPTPLQARVLVALAWTGLPPKDAIAHLSSAPVGALWPLLRLLRDRIVSGGGCPSLPQDLGRVLVARRPLARELLLSLAPSAPHTFFSECIGYETSEGVRIPEIVREELLAASDQHSHVPGHERLLAHYKALDGVADPRRVGGVDEMRAWLERAHHAALLRDEAEWKQLVPPCPEFYWARARWLSRICRDYDAAADVYFDGVARFPDDDYGWHYFAWNADRAGRPTDVVDRAYRKAIALDETNRWWNSRYVTFLIRRARYDVADKEYAEGLARLRTAGTEAELAPAYHRWIMQEWLEQGEVA
jgi:hypothetical protein